jgi:hypothetical protein
MKPDPHLRDDLAEIWRDTQPAPITTSEDVVDDAPEGWQVPESADHKTPANRGWQGGGATNRGATAPPLRRIDVVRLLTTPPPPVPWIAEPLLARGHLTLLVGREGRGKSLLAMAAAAGLLAGESVAGLDVPAPASVMLVDAENSVGELHRRLHCLGIGPDLAADRLAIFDGTQLDLGKPDHLTALADEVRAIGPDVLVIDSMRSTWTGKENDSDAAGPHLDRLRGVIARDLDVAVLVLHHSNKAGAYRGSTAIGASVDLLYVLERVEGDPDEHRRRLFPDKVRICSPPPPIWLRLNGIDGLDVLEIEVADPFDPDATVPLPAVRADVAQHVLDVLRDGAELRRADIARAAGRDPKDRTVGRVLKALIGRGEISRSAEGVYRIPGTPKDVHDPELVAMVIDDTDNHAPVKLCRRCGFCWVGIGTICDECLSAEGS